MKATTFIILVFGVLLMAGTAGAEMKEAKGKVTIEDAAGDVMSDEHPGKDVVQVVIDSDGKNLNITAVLEKPVEDYLVGHLAGDVIRLHLDTDNNPETGGKPFGFKTPSYEYTIDVAACISYGSEGTACSGGFGDTPVEKLFSTNDLYGFPTPDKREQISESFAWESRGKDIEGNKVEVSLPYSEMNLKSGQKIRISGEEVDGEFAAGRAMPDVLLTLN